MNSILLAIIAVFIMLILYDMRIFIRNKEPAKVYVLYIFLMCAGLIVSLLLAAGIRPVAPSRLIEAVFTTIGIAK